MSNMSIKRKKRKLKGSSSGYPYTHRLDSTGHILLFLLFSCLSIPLAIQQALLLLLMIMINGIFDMQAMRPVSQTTQPGLLVGPGALQPSLSPVILFSSSPRLSHLGRRAGERRRAEVGENQGNTFLFGFRLVWLHVSEPRRHPTCRFLQRNQPRKGKAHTPVCSLLGAQMDSEHIHGHPRNRNDSRNHEVKFPFLVLEGEAENH